MKYVDQGLKLRTMAKELVFDYMNSTEDCAKLSEV